MTGINTPIQSANPLQSVPYFYHEAEMTRMERIHRRDFIIIMTLIIIIALLLYGFLQYDYESYSVDLSTEGGGNANYIGQDGDINIGESEGPASYTPQEEG